MPTVFQLEKKLRHYTGKAIADYQMIKTGDRVLVCVSGGKDSLVMAHILNLLKWRSNHKFELTVFILDQGLPGFDSTPVTHWLDELNIPTVLHAENTYAIVQQKASNNKHCMLCSRLRRGIIYRYARENYFDKIALGHHRDDLITSLLMSIFYQGNIASMPPKLLTNDQRNIVIRPLCFCQEKDIADYARQKEMPIITKNLCRYKENPTRKQVQDLIHTLAQHNPKIPSNILHALQSVHPSQLMDRALWSFEELEGAKKFR